MYGNYGFCLDWDELSVELRDEKIDDYIRYNYENNNYVNEDGENDRELEEILEDQEERDDAENSISSRFPMYF